MRNAYRPVVQHSAPHSYFITLFSPNLSSTLSVEYTRLSFGMGLSDSIARSLSFVTSFLTGSLPLYVLVGRFKTSVVAEGWLNMRMGVVDVAARLRRRGDGVNGGAGGFGSGMLAG